MTRIRHHHRADEALIPFATSAPQPAPSERPRAVPARPLPPRRVHAPAVLAFLRGIDTTPAALGMRRPVTPSHPQSIVQTDWAARLADDWTAIAARIEAELIDAPMCALEGIRASYVHGVTLLTAPLIAQATELVAALAPLTAKAVA